MSLSEWLAEERLKKHRASSQELAALFRVIDRDIADAGVEDVSPDRRFSTAYNAALQLATVTLLASGYRTSASKPGHHMLSIAALVYTMGEEQQTRASFLDICRKKRNATDYDRAGVTQEEDVAELLAEVKEFRQEVLRWLEQNHPHLCSMLPD